MTWRTATLAVWAVLALAVAVLWLVAATGRAGLERPGSLLVRVCPPVVRRSVLLLAWMWLGWHLFAR